MIVVEMTPANLLTRVWCCPKNQWWQCHNQGWEAAAGVQHPWPAYALCPVKEQLEEAQPYDASCAPKEQQAARIMDSPAQLGGVECYDNWGGSSTQKPRHWQNGKFWISIAGGCQDKIHGELTVAAGCYAGIGIHDQDQAGDVACRSSLVPSSLATSEP